MKKISPLVISLGQSNPLLLCLVKYEESVSTKHRGICPSLFFPFKNLVPQFPFDVCKSDICAWSFRLVMGQNQLRFRQSIEKWTPSSFELVMFCVLVSFSSVVPDRPRISQLTPVGHTGPGTSDGLSLS